MGKRTRRFKAWKVDFEDNHLLSSISTSNCCRKIITMKEAISKESKSIAGFRRLKIVGIYYGILDVATFLVCPGVVKFTMISL